MVDQTFDDDVFNECTAWFSSSVSRERLKIWMDKKGKVVNFDDAMFLFSQRMDSTDTLDIYKSEAYLNEHLAVIHASYIDECVRYGSTKQVTLGEYFMPPKQVYDAIKSSVEFVWDKEDIPSSPLQESSRAKKQKTSHQRQSSDIFADFVNIDELPRVKGKLLPFRVGENGCTSEYIQSKRQKHLPHA